MNVLEKQIFSKSYGPPCNDATQYSPVYDRNPIVKAEVLYSSLKFFIIFLKYLTYFFFIRKCQL